jgi:uncharacterized membrane protein
MTPDHVTALAVHILSGAVGIIFGFVALFATKGAWLHRRTGIVFVYAMIAMGLVGTIMAAIWGRQPASNIPMGMLMVYLVTTSLTTVRPPAGASRALDFGSMLVALALSLTFFTGGAVAARSPGGSLKGIPAPMFFIFGSAALLASVGDLRMIRSGGVRALRFTPRLTRHLWRMCLAFLIAAFSFFLGQAKVIPKPIRILPLLMIPPLVVLAALLYWLWRVRIRKSFRGVGQDQRGLPLSGAGERG